MYISRNYVHNKYFTQSIVSNLKMTRAAYSEDTGSVIHNVDTFCKKEKKGLQIPLEKTLNRSAALTVICSSTMKPFTSITSLTLVSSVSAKH